MTKKKIVGIIALSFLGLFIIATTIYLSLSYTWEEVLAFIEPVITTAYGWLGMIGFGTLAAFAGLIVKVSSSVSYQKKAKKTSIVISQKLNEVIKKNNTTVSNDVACLSSIYQFLNYMAKAEISKTRKAQMLSMAKGIKAQIELKSGETILEAILEENKGK